MNLKKNRVEVVDALRGFAVAAILLLHSIEHFIYNVYPVSTNETEKLINQSVWDALFFLFAGKSYAIFALLFGFTFIVQQRNQECKGEDFGIRFAWRLILLMLFATLNAAFFPGGDVLMLFAITGFIMIPMRKLPVKALLPVALIFLIQPIELLACLGIDVMPVLPVGDSYKAVNEATGSGVFWKMVWENITTGQLASLYWAINAGRFLQTAGLLMLGMIVARGNYFSREIGFWVKTFVIGFISAFVLYVAKSATTQSLQTIFTMWFNIAFTAVLIAVFVILYQNDAFKKMTSGLSYYGRMSLTNYIGQSIIGSIIFFPYAFGLADKLGIAWSLVVGIMVMLLQIQFCKIWLKRYKQGPLESLWKRATWIMRDQKPRATVAVDGEPVN